MANINVGLQDTSDPNYMKAGSEPSRADYQMGRGETVGLENFLTTMKGASAAVGAIANGGYNQIVEGIRNDVTGGTDALRGAQGVDLATTQAGAGGEPLNLDKGGNPNAVNPLAENKPPNPDVIQGGMSRLQAAYNQGKISDTNYYAQLEAMTRQVRSRYPGFQEEVDAMVHSVTGITPANALRKSLLNDMETAAAKANDTDKAYQGFIRQNLEYLPKDYWDKEKQGQPYQQAEIYKYVGEKQKSELEVKNASAALELKSKTNQVDATEAQQAATISAQTVDKTGIESFLNARLEDQKKGVVYTPEQTGQIKAELGQLRFKAEQDFDAKMNAPLVPGSKNSLATTVNDPAKLKAIREESLRVFDLADKALTDKDYGSLNIAKNAIAAMHDADAKKILQENNTIRAVGAISSIPGGKEAVTALMSRPGDPFKNLTQETQSIIDSFTVNNATGGKYSQSGVTSIPQQLDAVAKRGPSAVKDYTERQANLLSNPGVPAENKAEAAKIFFGDSNMKFLSSFDSASQQRLFHQFVSPATTKSMVELKSSHPEIWQQYTNWAQNAFVTVFSQAGRDISSVPDRPWINVHYDDKANQFVVSPTEEGMRVANKQGPMAASFSVMQRLERMHGSSIEDSVTKMNAAIKSIEPVLKANGFDTSQEIKNLTKGISITDKKNSTIWQWLLKKTERVSDNLSDTFGGTHVNFTQASGDNEGSRGKLLSLDKSSTDDIKAAFSQGESNNDYNRLVDTPTHPKRTNLTDMTIGEVLDFQKGMLRAGNPSSAAGKYQIVSTTLKSLVREGVVKLGDKYDENTQERLADALLERRGLSDFMSGKLPARQFLKNLGNEWEIIKKSPSYARKIIAALEESKNGD